MTMLELLDDCVNRARAVPDQVAHLAGREAVSYCDTLLADLDLTLEHCLAAVRTGEDLDLVVSQILQLKWLVYTVLRKRVARAGWSETAIAALSWSATCDLRDSRERFDDALGLAPVPLLAQAG